MKRVLVTSLAAMLAMGMSGTAQAHGYPAPAGGSIYWADGNVVIGLNYGQPYVVPYYAPPRYVYRPRVYRPAYYGKRHDHYKSYSGGYRKAHYRGYRHDHRDDHRGRGRGHGRDRWDD